MRLMIGRFDVFISARDTKGNSDKANLDDTIQFLHELAVFLHSSGKWERKQGNKFTAESARSWGNDITEAIKKIRE